MHLKVGREFTQALPKDVRKALVDFGGRNLFGGPNYRLSWGWSRRAWTEAGVSFRYDTPERHLERWHLERWAPPSMYGTPYEWYTVALKATPDGGVLNVMGEFPSEGDYERILTFENVMTREPMKPTVDLVIEAITRNRQHREQSKQQIADKISARLSAKAAEEARRKDDRLTEMEAPFAMKHWISMSGKNTPEWRRRPDWQAPHGQRG